LLDANSELLAEVGDFIKQSTELQKWDPWFINQRYHNHNYHYNVRWIALGLICIWLGIYFKINLFSVNILITNMYKY
jgi:hypothetical protein